MLLLAKNIQHPTSKNTKQRENDTNRLKYSFYGAKHVEIDKTLKTPRSHIIGTF